MIFQVFCAFVAIFSFAILIGVPKKYLLHSGFIGGGGWLVYLLFCGNRGHMLVGTFMAAVFIAVISHIFARIFKSPVIIFFIPGILTIVPGAGMYHIAYSIFQGQQNKTVMYFIETLQVAGAIALAIFLVDALVYQIWQEKRGGRKNKDLQENKKKEE